MSELFIEYMPERSEELISDFYYGKYDRLILETGYSFYFDKEGTFRGFPYYKYNENYKSSSKYKVYYIISNETYDRDCIEEDLFKAYPEIYGFKYVQILDKNGKPYVHNGKISREVLPHETKYTFSDLKKKNSNIRTMYRIIARLLYSNQEKIKENDLLDLNFKAPFKLMAKKLNDIGFAGCYGPKSGHFLIEGIRVVKKEYCYLTDSFVEESYYFPEKHPELYRMIKDEN